LSQFSRSTIIEACATLESLTHAQIDRFLLRFGLENIAPQNVGSKVDRTNALIKHLIENPDSIGPSGANLTYEIIQNIVARKTEAFSTGWYPRDESIEDEIPKLIHSLKRDGYTITEDGLKVILPEDIQLAEKNNELDSLLRTFGFNTAQGHLNQALSAHTRGEWAAANAQMRAFIEGLFDSIAELLVSEGQTLPATSHGRRELLARLTPPFISPSLNEWEIGSKGGFLQGVWQRLHPQGSHPGLSDEEDSTFRLHLVVLVAWHYLKRLQVRLDHQGKSV
jgi:hypothetical protein